MSCSLTLSRTGGKSKDLVVKPVVPEVHLIRKVLLLLRPKIGGAHCTPGSNGPAPPEIGGGPLAPLVPSALFSLSSFRLSLISLCKVHEAHLQGCVNSQNNFTKIEFFTQQVTFFHENQILHHTVAHYICFRTVISQLNFCPDQPGSNLQGCNHRGDRCDRGRT